MVKLKFNQTPWLYCLTQNRDDGDGDQTSHENGDDRPHVDVQRPSYGHAPGRSPYRADEFYGLNLNDRVACYTCKNCRNMSTISGFH